MTEKTIKTLAFFGIYPLEIERVNDICCEVLENLGVDVDKAFDEIYDMFYDTQLDGVISLTNELIICMFDVTRRYIKSKHRDLDVSYYVNGMDSDIMIGGEYAQNYEFEHNDEEDEEV